MSTERDMSGTLNRNADKAAPGANEKWPDYKGAIRIEGRDYWLSGWIREGPRGKFLSLSANPKDAAPDHGTRPPASDDGMPF
jgi:hypothetical protein